ncbi:MAG: three-Cys-motif partner protein TcmP [Nitrospirae bacterium]|nr:three-Cys-motif partner protein TcmP [Nitrospirota bacterium]
MSKQKRFNDNTAILSNNSIYKHFILNDYLPPWLQILGSYGKRLNYFDCFAGPGKYKWKNKIVDGSPLIAINKCVEILSLESKKNLKEINLYFFEIDKKNFESLKSEIDTLISNGLPNGLNIEIFNNDGETIIENLMDKKIKLAPTLFFIDPYGHPYSFELMRKIMKLNKVEIFLNFMYYQIIRDIPNPDTEERCKRLFYPDDYHNLDLKVNDKFDAIKFLVYQHQRIDSKYYVPFNVNFGTDEPISSNRLKYQLIHYSNHFKAFSLMLNIMQRHSEHENSLIVRDGQLQLPFETKEESLNSKLLKKYNSNESIKFDEIVENNWKWYFKETDYRNTLKEMEKENLIHVKRITSKTSKGLSGDDIIKFGANDA